MARKKKSLSQKVEEAQRLVAWFDEGVERYREVEHDPVIRDGTLLRLKLAFNTTIEVLEEYLEPVMVKDWLPPFELQEVIRMAEEEGLVTQKWRFWKDLWKTCAESVFYQHDNDVTLNDLFNIEEVSWEMRLVIETIKDHVTNNKLGNYTAKP